MEARLLWAALWRRRGVVSLAVLAIAIGASVASALLHVNADVTRKVSHELRALGPDMVLMDEGGADGASGYLDEATARARMRSAGLSGTPVLFVTARAEDGSTIPISGADLPAARRLHPSWRLEGRGAGDDGQALAGVRLASRLGLRPGGSLALRGVGEDERVVVRIGATLRAGAEDDDALWVPLPLAQRLAGLPGRVSMVQMRVGDPARAAAAERALERGGGMDATVLHALSDTEARLLERLRRLMALVTVAALLAAGLCAFGTLTDLALERRRDIALVKALGADRADVVRQFLSESVVIGVAGGASGWLLGLMFAEVIGTRVFASPIALRWDVPLQVLALALLVALVAGIGPLQYALRLDPAPVLKGD